MNKDHSKLKIIKLLKDTQELLTPEKDLLEKLLLQLDSQDVTKKEYPRYNYSMSWKFAVPIFLAVIILVGFFAYKNYSGNPINPIQQLNQSSQTSQNQTTQTVTAQNIDTTLNQTDTTMQQSIDQMDNDLKDVGALNQEEDPNSL